MSQFRQHLEDFVFFHLGADARVAIEVSDRGLMVRLEHHRIESFSFQVSLPELQILAQDFDRCEQFLLDHMNSHRR